MKHKVKLLLVWLVLFGAWEGAYRVVGWRSWIFPAPSHVLDATLELVNIHTCFGEPVGPGWPVLSWYNPEARTDTGPIYKGPLIQAVPVSFVRLAEGFVVSLLLGAFLGMLMWRRKFFNDLLGSLLLGFQTLPSVCWVPLAILVFGLEERSILFVLVMGSFSAIAISFRDGMKSIPPLYLHAGKMLGARRWRLFFGVMLPASLPTITSSLRQGFAFAWRSLMGAEFVFVMLKYHGLGYLLSNARDVGALGRVMALMGIMVGIGMAVDRLGFAKLEKRVHTRFGLTATP